MALVARPKAPQQVANLSLRQALQDFRAVLTQAEQVRLTSTIQSTTAPNAAAVLELTQEIDEASAKGRTRRIGVRLQPFLDGIHQFTAVVDAFIGLGPSIAETIWGIVKMTLLLASNAASYFEKLTSLLTTISDTIPRYKDYAALYYSSQRLQDALCGYFATLIRLCLQAVKISRTPTALRLLRTSVWPFEIDFGPLQTSLQQASQKVNAEVQVAAAKLQVEEAELQKAERLETSKSRNLLASFSSSARQAFGELQQRWDEYDARQKRRTILQLISCLFQVDHVRAWRMVYKQGMTGTAEWFKKDHTFLSWCSAQRSTLLRVQGQLGCGKSVLVANIVAHLQVTPMQGSKVVHFFCRDATASSLSAQAIVRSICGQLIQDSLEKQPMGTLDLLLATASKAENHEILEVTLRHMSTYDTIHFIIDNLDYCNDDDFDQVLDAVRELWDHFNARSCSVKVLLATRSDTRGKIHGLFPANLIMNMQENAIDSDLNSYVENTLLQNLECSKMHFDDPTLAVQVCDYIVEGAEGMFLWASLVLEEICMQSTDQAIIEILQSPPPELKRLFERTLLRAHTSHRYPYIGNVLMWTLGAKCELSLPELCQALSVKHGQDRPGPSRSAAEVTSAIASMRGLVYLDEDDATIRLVHHSFRNYLLDISRADELTEFKFDATEVQIDLAHLCMIFLDFNIFTLSLAKRTTHDEAALVVSQLVGASNNALQNESKTALSVLKARKHLRQLSTRSQSPSNETVLRDVEHRLAEHIARMAETARTTQSRQTDYPFLEYARKFWYQHAFSLTPETNDPAWVLFRRLFRSKRPHYDQPWYGEDYRLSSAPMDAFGYLDLTTLQSIGWSCSKFHMAAMAATLENQFLTVAKHMSGGLEHLDRLAFLVLLCQVLLSPPSQRMARAVCFRLENDEYNNFRLHWGSKWTFGKFYKVSHEVKTFLAAQFDLPEYMDANKGEYERKIWFEWELARESLAAHSSATRKPLAASLPFSIAPNDVRGMRPAIRDAVRRDRDSEYPQSQESKVHDVVRNRLDNDHSSLSLLDLSIIYGSLKTVGKIYRDSCVDVDGLIATALFEGAFDVIEQFLWECPDAKLIEPIALGLPIVALWLSKADLAAGISRLALDLRNEDGYRVLPGALRYAFRYTATEVFVNLSDILRGRASDEWRRLGVMEDLDALRLYIGRATTDNPSPARRKMVRAYDSAITSSGPTANLDFLRG